MISYTTSLRQTYARLREMANRYFCNLKSVVSLVKKANEKLYEIEITPKIKEVFPLIASIMDYVEQYAKLSCEEVESVNCLCYKLNAYRNVKPVHGIFIGCDRDHKSCPALFTTQARMFRELFEIGTKWLVHNIHFYFPNLIDNDVLEDVARILQLNQSRLVEIDSIPLEVLPLGPILSKRNRTEYRQTARYRKAFVSAPYVWHSTGFKIESVLREL